MKRQTKQTVVFVKKEKLNKKAQIETMGLLVIVILISVILFFALSINLNKTTEGQPKKQEFKDLQAVSSMGTTMLETTGPCKWTIRELLSDCAYAKEINCEGYNSCQTANKTMIQILDLTLNKWGYEYNLTVTDSYGGTIMTTATGCQDDSQSSTEITPFSAIQGSMSIKIKYCSK